MRDIVIVLMEGKLYFYEIHWKYSFFVIGVPNSADYTKIIEHLLAIPGVRAAHSLHIWSLSLQKTALSVHIAIGIHFY